MSTSPAIRFVFAVALAFLSAAPVSARERRDSGATPLVWVPASAEMAPTPREAPDDGPGGLAPVVAASTCNAEINGDNITDFASVDAQALRDALAAVAANGTVKIAGYCAGALPQGGTTQTALITQTITLAGGYTTTDWTTYNPAGNPSTLDALLGGRVISATAAATLRGFMVTGGYISSTVNASGGGINAAGAMTLSEMTVAGNTITGNSIDHHGGGAYIGGPANVANTTFSNNVAKIRGGGLYANTTLTLSGTQFLSNTATGHGGGTFANGAVTLNGGLFQNNASSLFGGGLYAVSTLALSGTQFLSNTADYGGGVLALGAVTLNGGVFQNNRAGTDGGGLYVYTLALSGTQFLSNTATTGDGGGAWAIAARPNGGVFQNNRAGRNGGGLYAFSTLALTSTQFLSNTATNGSGGAAFVLGEATLSGGMFQNNSAGDRGGGLIARSTLALSDTQTLNGGVFQNNRAGFGGGGLYARSTLVLSGTQFLSNTATDGSGGGVRAVRALTLNGVVFQNNRAGFGGGGLHVQSTLALNGGVFQNNRAGENGGGLYAESTLALTSTQFLGNVAGFSGGGLYLAMANAKRVVNALFARNAATLNGAAIYAEDAGPLSLIHTTIVSPTAPAGATETVYVFAGTVYLTNTLIATHTIGIARAGGTVSDWNTLFAGVATPYNGAVTSVGGITGAARFANPASDDYHLGAGSAALNAGIDAGVYTDFEGQARPFGAGFDIGYDESVIGPLAYLPMVVR